ncbi:MAG: hypothetical protein ABJB74_03050 [Gemmatimonas sp.]
MLNREVVATGAVTFTVSPDAQALSRRSMGAIVHARLVDELTGDPVTTATRVRPAGAGFSNRGTATSVRARVASSGVVGLVGIPGNVVSDLATPPTEYGLTIEADGYIAVTQTALFSTPAASAGDFSPFDFGDISLHRTPITILGRVTKRQLVGAAQPLQNAVVSVDGIWRAPTVASSPAPPQPADVIALQTALRAPRIANSDHVQRCALSVGAETAHLERAASSDDRTLHLTNRNGMAPNSVLALNAGQADQREFAVIATIDTSLPSTEAGTIALQHPLSRDHAQNTPIALCTVQLNGTAEFLAVDAIVGDSSLLLSATTGLGTPNFVEVSGTGAPEYHACRTLTATTNADGFYALPALHRLYQVRMRITSGALTPIVENADLDYSTREQRVDFTFP